MAERYGDQVRTTQYRLEFDSKSRRALHRPKALFDKPRTLQVAGMFAGIGGIELGLRRANHRPILLCENDPRANAVLDARFPDIRRHDDIRSLASLPDETDLVVAGFPCQDLSQAGRTEGIAGTQSRLVGEVLRLLQAQAVPLLLLENVPFMLRLGSGRALEVIVSSLEELGYWWAYRVVDTRAFGLPHRRRRVFLVACLAEDPRTILFADDAGVPDPAKPTANAAFGFYWTEGIRGLGWTVNAIPTLKGGSSVGIPSPPAIWMPDGRIVKPHLNDAERLQGFRSNWTRPAESVGRPGYRWKLVGNAVTVDVAKWLGVRLAMPATFRVEDARRLPKGSPWPDAAWNVGDGRYTANVSAWPKQPKRRDLADFLRHEPDPLSMKATAGFLSRAAKSTLRFAPGFLDALASHLDRMQESASV